MVGPEPLVTRTYGDWRKARLCPFQIKPASGSQAAAGFWAVGFHLKPENQAVTSRAPIGQSNPAILTSIRALKARIRLPTISISNRFDTILTR